MLIPAAGAPLPPPPQHGVRVQCPCGWAFQAPPECEGKTVRCPGCNGGIVVPASDPLGVGPLESIPAATLYSASYDSTERLAKQLAWIAGGSVALLLFAMFVTYLIFRLPNQPPHPPVAAEVQPQAKNSTKAQSTEQPAAQTTPTLPAEKNSGAAIAERATPLSASRPPLGTVPPPGTAVATDASRDGDSIDPLDRIQDRMKFGPSGPRFGPRFGPRGPAVEPRFPGNESPPPTASNSSSDSTADRPSPGVPAVAADSGPPAVTRLPSSVQSWLEQPGDKLTGLRRVGSDQTPNTHFSWLTGLLPYLDQQQVYEKFDFSQPVNSERNLKAGATSVPAFLNPLDDQKTWDGYPFHGMALTHFVGMSGVEDARNVVAAKLPRSDPRAGVFGYDEVARPAQITDGQSQTIMMAGAGALPNPWVFGGGGTIRGAREPLFAKTSGLGTKGLPGGAIVVMADGSVRHINSSVDPQVFKAMSTIHGSESVDLERSAPTYALDQLRPATTTTPHSSYSNQLNPPR